MTREELEKELEAHGWDKRYHGTHTALWQKEHALIDMTDRGVEIGSNGITSPRLPWDIVDIENGKVIIHWEVEL